jgi:preprotein translocase subunit SecG
MILAAWYHPIVAVIFAFLAVLLMGVILLQRGRGVGLAGAFGGAGGNTAFGAKTGDALTWITVVAAGVFLVFAVVLNYVFLPQKVTGLSTPADVAEQFPIPTPTVTTPPPVSGAAGPPLAPAPTAPAEEPISEAQPTPAEPDAQPPAEQPSGEPASEPENPPGAARRFDTARPPIA